MKKLTTLHKPALFIFFFMCFATLSAQQTSKPPSNRWLLREAFKDLNHWYFAAQFGMPLPIGYYDTPHGSEAFYVFSLNGSAPAHRVVGGYKFKRHYFEVSAEGKLYMPYYASDPTGPMQYPTLRLGYYASAGYNIDLVPKLNTFKINVGGSFGGFFPIGGNPTVAAGMNVMFEVPLTRTVSIFADFRYMIGFTPIASQNYYFDGKVNTKVMTFDMNLGFRVNLFNKKTKAKGWNNYEELKRKNQ
jgi:hypothetical protein